MRKANQAYVASIYISLVAVLSPTSIFAQDRSVLVEYCAKRIIGKRVVNNVELDGTKDPLCICFSQKIDLQKYPDIIQNVDQFLDRKYYFSDTEKKLFAAVRYQCERSPDVIAKKQEGNEQKKLETLDKLCYWLDLKKVNCGCFTSRISGEFDDRAVRITEEQIYKNNISGLEFFLNINQKNAILDAIRECK